MNSDNEKLLKAYERTQMMLDATPICIHFWDENFQNLDCNQEAVTLFGLKSKQEYLERFVDLSPKYQPDGRLSKEKRQELISQALESGHVKFEWMHKKLDGEPLPVEITLVRVGIKEHYFVVGYTQDLRKLKRTMEKKREAELRTQVMFDAMPLCCSFWDKHYNSIDCNQETVQMFGLKDKQEYLDRFFDLSPEYQPGGERSDDLVREKIKKAFLEGKIKFEWMHRKLDGELIPAEVTLVRVQWNGEDCVVGYTMDLRELKETMAKKHEADQRTQIMLDATPLCCNFWDKEYNNIDCNQEAIDLFELENKKEYLERFFELSPKYQPNGQLSVDLVYKKINEAFLKGRIQFEWTHQKLNGELIPAEITLVRVQREGEDCVVGYTRDLRELKETMEKMREADRRTQIMLDATPLCCNFWDENFNNIDCNQEAVNLFELNDKREYLDRFFELSPKYQPDGRLSSEKAFEKIKCAFETGRTRFEWMHQKINGELIPAEIILVRVWQGEKYIVTGYTRDLRELKQTIESLGHLEEIAFIDSLTGAYNRRYFMDTAEEELSQTVFTHDPFSIIMMDIDHFKEINDRYGHAVGDGVLKRVVDTAQSVLRTTDTLARYGGEEFVVMASKSDIKLASIVAERIRTKIEQSEIEIGGYKMNVTVSLGVATKTKEMQPLLEIIDEADKALYRAKEGGRNLVISQ